jgi:putative transposase
MRTYLRNRAPGGTYFFTVNLAERKGNTLLVDRIDDLRCAIRATRAKRPFEIIAMVVLPDHLHAVWRLPEGDCDYSTRWRLLKGRFAHAVGCDERRSSSRLRKQERGIWQRRYWEHTILDEYDLQMHINYIHYNPVKHGLCSAPTDWAYSTFHRYAQNGWLPSNWAGASLGP